MYDCHLLLCIAMTISRKQISLAYSSSYQTVCWGFSLKLARVYLFITESTLRVLSLGWLKCRRIRQFSLKLARVYLGNQCVSGSVLGDIPGQERGTPYGQHPLLLCINVLQSNITNCYVFPLKNVKCRI